MSDSEDIRFLSIIVVILYFIVFIAINVLFWVFMYLDLWLPMLIFLALQLFMAWGFKMTDKILKK